MSSSQNQTALHHIATADNTLVIKQEFVFMNFGPNGKLDAKFKFIIAKLQFFLIEKLSVKMLVWFM